MKLRARFDKIGRFQPTNEEERDALTAHYIIEDVNAPISGGLYILKNMPFPEEGILIKLEKAGKENE